MLHLHATISLVLVSFLLLWRWFFYVRNRIHLLPIPPQQTPIRNVYRGLQKGARVLVTGGCGALGRRVVETLLKEFLLQVSEVSVVDAFVAGPLHKGVHYIEGDITDLKLMTRACADKDLVIHLGALIDLRSEERHWPRIHNVNVVEACVRAGVPALIYCSSSSARHDVSPLREESRSEGGAGRDNSIFKFDADDISVSLYGKSKNLGERAVIEANGRGCLRTAAIAPAGICGYQDRMIFDLKYQNLRLKGSPGIAVARIDSESERGFCSFSYNVSVGRAMALAGLALLDTERRDSIGGHTFYVTDFDIDLLEFHKRLNNEFVRSFKGAIRVPVEALTYMPRWLFVAVRLMIGVIDWFFDGNVKADITSPFQLLGRGHFEYTIGKNHVYNAKAQEMLGFKPVPLDTVMKEVIERYVKDASN